MRIEPASDQARRKTVEEACGGTEGDPAATNAMAHGGTTHSVTNDSACSIAVMGRSGLPLDGNLVLTAASLYPVSAAPLGVRRARRSRTQKYSLGALCPHLFTALSGPSRDSTHARHLRSRTPIPICVLPRTRRAPRCTRKTRRRKRARVWVCG